MREQLLEWADRYPKLPASRDPNFKGSPLRALVCREIPRAIKSAVSPAADLHVTGGIGEGRWTDTPWVALLDAADATTVEDGVYVVYLLSLGADRLYLAIAQGVTGLYESLGKKAADIELRRRADLMRPLLVGHADRFRPIAMSLKSRSWRGPLYEAGTVVGVEYSVDAMPPEAELIADLKEVIRLYRDLSPVADWRRDSEMLKEARRERGVRTYIEAKRYRNHRSIERRTPSKAVKEALGTCCQGCKVELTDRYGRAGKGVIEAHHLRPLSTLADGESVEYDVTTDFAVLCPNCHRVIHRMKNPADLEALRRLISRQARAF